MKKTNWVMFIYILFFSVNALSSSVVLGGMATNWSTIDTQGKAMMVILVIQNWTNMMLALIVQIAKQEGVQLPQTPIPSTQKPTNEKTNP